MINLVILGRHRLAEGMLSCAEEMGGRQRFVYPLDSKPGDSEAIFARELELVLDNVSGSKLVLVDHSLGVFPRVCQKLALLPETRVICGLNVAMLLGLFECRTQVLDLDGLAAKAVQLGTQGIRIL